MDGTAVGSGIGEGVDQLRFCAGSAIDVKSLTRLTEVGESTVGLE